MLTFGCIKLSECAARSTLSGSLYVYHLIFFSLVYQLEAYQNSIGRYLHTLSLSLVFAKLYSHCRVRLFFQFGLGQQPHDDNSVNKPGLYGNMV